MTYGLRRIAKHQMRILQVDRCRRRRRPIAKKREQKKRKKKEEIHPPVIESHRPTP